MRVNIFYVYVDFTDDGRPFYVGKGKMMRINRKYRNECWRNMANKYGYNRVILLGTKDESYAFEMEIKLIEEYKTFRDAWKDKSGWGSNLTFGGEGTSGRSGPLSPSWGKSPSEEARKKMSAAQKNRICSEETRMKMSKSHLGKTRSEEAKRNISNGQIGRKHSEETKLKISNLAKERGGRPHTEEAKRKISMAKLGKPMGPCSEESKANLSILFSGENNPAAKLNLEKVNSIRKLISDGKTNSEIRSIYFNEISIGCISDIRHNRTWKV